MVLIVLHVYTHSNFIWLTVSYRTIKLSSFFFSSFFWQVSLCFQRVAAEILGIRLTKPEVEQHQRVVKAEIIDSKHETAAKPVASPAKSSLCSIQ